MTALEPVEVVDRIWARDSTIWTGTDEAHWLGWLDEPSRMLERIDELESLDRDYDDIVLLGMGGSSLAPEVIRRTFGISSFHVLDTTHPSAIRRLEDAGRPREDALHRGVEVRDDARDALPARLLHGAWRDVRRDHRPGHRARGARQGARVRVGRARRADDRRAVLRALALRHGAGGADGSRRPQPPRARGHDGPVVPPRRREPGPRVRAASSARAGARAGTRSASTRRPGGFGLWAEQLLAESTGKEGKGLVPAPGEDPAGGPDRQHGRVRLDDPYDLGAEFFRWEFATAVAGSILGDQPVHPAGRAGGERQDGANFCHKGQSLEPGPEGSIDELLDAGGAAAVHRDPGLHRPRARGRARSARRACPRDRLRRHEGPRPALPALDRPAAQGRPEHGARGPGRGRLRRGARDPGPRVRLPGS